MSGEKGATKRVISAPIILINAMGPLNDQNHTPNFIVEAVNAEKQLWQLIRSKGPLHIDGQKLYRKARSSYEEIIVNDHELAELQDIEYSLWKLHYKYIDEYRNRIREASSLKKCANLASDNLLEGLKSFLSEATEFYQDLITKIRRSYGLPKELLVFNSGVSSSMESSEICRCQFSCHRSLVFLGDLARYKELYGNPNAQDRNWSFAAIHYLNASMIWPDSGNPQNQLAVLATYLGDEFLALYHCIRSLAVKEPFPDAWDNLILLFDKNWSSRLHSLSNEATFDFSKPSERSTVQNTAEDVVMSEQNGLWSLIVRTISFFYVKSSLDEFPFIFGSTIRQLEALFLLDDVSLKAALESYQPLDVARMGPFRGLQLVCVFIFTFHTLSESPQLQNPRYIKFKQHPALIQQALASTFICMGRLVERCMVANPVDRCPLLPSILVFIEWLVGVQDKPETIEADEKCENAMGYFFGVFVNLLNQLEKTGGEIKSQDFSTLWEDHELLGFLPVCQSHELLDFSTHREPRNEFGDQHECQVRISRILLASMKVVNRSNGTRKWIFYEKTARKFYATESKELLCKKELEATEGGLDLKVRELQQNFGKSVQPLCEPTEESQVKTNDGDKNNLDVHRISTLVEEEEVILFKPIMRYNSAPLYVPVVTADKLTSSGESLCRNSSLLPQKQISGDPSGFFSNTTGSRMKKISWQEPLIEESVIDPFTGQSVDSPRFGIVDNQTGGVSSIAGPPSLSAWVLGRENFGITGEKDKNDSSKYGSGHIKDISSAYVTSLSAGENAPRQPDMKVTSSSHFMYGFSSEGDSVIGAMCSSSPTHYVASPYMPPLPSAPLLPDDATWSSSDSSNYSECKDSEDMKEQFFDASRVNIYSNLTGIQGCSPNFDPTIPRFSYGDSAQRLHHYQGNLILDQAHWPVQSHSPTNLGRFHDEDFSRLSLFDRWTNPLTSKPKEHLQDPQWNPGYQNVYGNDEQGREKLFHGHQRPSPYWYGAAMDLRSEQHLLLQYLKEKELRLQLESKLRGPSQK
ncbi:DNA/RNA-binding domain [Macleaya cordata]|uniref:DNA/RNA-binding domain n=1 Tax=Macleaya cordata TaxID=56857 RepID=A0A200PQ97_MACCD|nr:DNA/RNA-binding domain [Macleaya cordata]